MSRLPDPVPGRQVGRGFSAGHQAVDIPAPAGTPVVSIGDGYVVAAGQDGASPYNLDLSESGGGLLVAVRHVVAPDAGAQPSNRAIGNPWQLGVEGVAQYAHLSALAPGIRPGVAVRAGQQLGAVGATGNATGNHLHFGLRIGGVWVDYRNWPPFGRPVRLGLPPNAPSNAAGPLQAVFTGDKLLPKKPNEQCPPGYDPAAVDPRLASVPLLDVLTGWAGTKPYDQLAPGEANACVLRGAFSEGDEANKVGVAEAYGLLGQGLDAFGDIARNGLLLLGLLAVLILGAWALARGGGGGGGNLG